ncbi:MAG: DUF1667 domain-containing protein [Clostridiales bacterium]|jgi:CxxC motif-containing protein|nr:DUF1667 domain-containing protein [Clostridiales bacterium]
MTKEKELVCIVCPESCRLSVAETDGVLAVEGNGCKRGEAHALNEYTRPMRMLTSVVAVESGVLPRLPVISDGEIPKDKIDEALRAIYKIRVAAPVLCGDVIIKNICGTDVDIVASRSMRAAI